MLFFNNDTVNKCIFSVIMTTSLTFNTKKQSYADLPKVKHSKNLGNNDSFSKVFRGGLRYYMILEKHPEILQKNGYFPMGFFLKSLQNYRKFNYEKRVKEQLALPLLNSGRCAHRPLYNRHIAVRANKRDRNRQTVGRYKRKATGSARVSGQ